MHHYKTYRQAVDLALEKLEESEKLIMLYENEHNISKCISEYIACIPKQIKIEIEFDSDSTICLKGYSIIDGFSGFGEAWFNSEGILSFARSILDFDDVLELSGGNYGEGGILVDKQFGLTISELSPNHKYGMYITLADQPGTYCRPEEVRRFSGELKFTKKALLQFSKDLLDLLFERKKSIVVYGD